MTDERLGETRAIINTCGDKVYRQIMDELVKEMLTAHCQLLRTEQLALDLATWAAFENSGCRVEFMVEELEAVRKRRRERR